MGTDRLKKMLEEQRGVYHALRKGDTNLVCYKEYRDGR